MFATSKKWNIKKNIFPYSKIVAVPLVQRKRFLCSRLPVDYSSLITDLIRPITGPFLTMLSKQILVGLPCENTPVALGEDVYDFAGEPSHGNIAIDLPAPAPFAVITLRAQIKGRKYPKTCFFLSFFFFSPLNKVIKFVNLSRIK